MVAQTHGSKLNTPTFIVALLITVASFAAWVLASINIRRLTQGLGKNNFNKIDPSLVVLGVLSMLYFLGILAKGSSNAFKASTVVAISTLFALWYLGNAIAYTVKRYDSPRYCSTEVRDIAGLEGCHGLYQSLMAICWTSFGLLLIYILYIFLRAKKHATLPWTRRESGLSTPVGRLTPGDYRTKEQLAAEEATV